MKLKYVNFIVLAVILAAGVFTFWTAANERMTQLFVGIATAIAYLLWGLIYHTLEGDLRLNVVIEYSLVSAIAITLLLTILWT